MPQYLVSIGMLLLALVSGCTEEAYVPKADEFFKSHMNLIPLPEGISGFHGLRSDTEPLDYGEGHLEYRARADFINALLQHGKFPESSEMNNVMHPFNCAHLLYESTHLYSRLGHVSSDGKVCYSGIYVPYHHLIVYDPKTEMADHYYYWIRD